MTSAMIWQHDNAFNTTANWSVSLHSLLNSSCSHSALETPPAKIMRMNLVAYGIVAPIILVVGIVGNCLNLVVLTRPNMKSVTYYYLTALAISDLMSLIFTIPLLLRLIGLYGKDFYSAIYYAYVELAIANAFMAASVFIVVAVTIDRYISISLPTEFKNFHTKRHAKIVISLAYICAFLVYVPVCFFKTICYVPEVDSNGKQFIGYMATRNLDVNKAPAWQAYIMIKEVLVRMGPTVVLAILNIFIIINFRKVVKKRKSLLGNHHPSDESSTPSSSARNYSNGTQKAAHHRSANKTTGGGPNIQEEQRLVMLLIGIVILFFVTMTPAAMLTIFSTPEREQNYGFQVFRAVANDMEFINYAMNFYIYCLCSSEIRKTFLEVFWYRKSISHISSRFIPEPVNNSCGKLIGRSPITHYKDNNYFVTTSFNSQNGENHEISHGNSQLNVPIANNNTLSNM